MHGLRNLLLLSLLALGPGCVSTEILAVKGDIACEPVPHQRKRLPLTVGVWPFEDATGERLPRGTTDAFTRSYVKIVDESALFLDVAKLEDLRARGVEPDLIVRGRVLSARLERNYAWLTGWGVFAVVTFGYGAFIGPLIGLPWARDEADMALDLRIETAPDARLVTRHAIEWRDKLFLTAYSGEDSKTGYAEDARVPLQEVTGRAALALVDDYGLWKAIADARGGRLTAKDGIRRDAGPAPLPDPPPLPPLPPPSREPKRAPAVAKAPPARATPPPVAPVPASAPVAEAASLDETIGTIERIDSRFAQVVVGMSPGVAVKTGDVLEVVRGANVVTRVGRVRVVRALPGERGAFSAASERGEPVERFRAGDRLVRAGG